MLELHVPRVGDGLAVAVDGGGGVRALLDCGSRRHPYLAYCRGLLATRPSVFILSHFHIDHYSGLLQASRTRPRGGIALSDVYFPAMPDLPDGRDFLCCLFAMHHYLLGDTSGHMAVDLRELLRHVSHTRFRCRGLSAGQTIDMGEASLQVLWPPNTVERDGAVSAAVRRALHLFDKAKESSEELALLHDIAQDQERVFAPYLDSTDGAWVEPAEQHEGFWGSAPRLVGRALPKAVREANEALRVAANRLSLALCHGHDVLFLGDLEKQEIEQVVDKLARADGLRWRTLLTAHHGTHWHESLHRLSVTWAISSVGAELQSKVNRGYDRISDIHLTTGRCGSVTVGACLTWGSNPCCAWHSGRCLRQNVLAECTRRITASWASHPSRGGR